MVLDVRKHRLDYGAMLIPPHGYRLAKAVAATYSLDLNTLLSIPIALFFSQTLEGKFEAERVQLLEAIQRCPDVLRVYHQSGKIHVPRNHNRLYGLLEPCVVGILPDNAHTAFHPKVWVLRYEHVENDEAVPKYRVIVLSRNLTYDRSWDIAAHLDGEVTGESKDKNEPLVSFVEHLLSYEQFAGSEEFLVGLRTVDFQAPKGFNHNFFFHPVGVNGYVNPIKTRTASRAICISPFFHEEAIQTLRNNVTGDLWLFGRSEELRRLPPSSLEGIHSFCLSNYVVDGESAEEGEDGDGEQCQQNLHAKLFVYRGDSRRNIWYLGSANATKAAFDRNIEFVLELRGKGESVQLERLKDELLGADEKQGIFDPYLPSDQEVTDSAEKQLEQKLRTLEFEILKHLQIERAEVTRCEIETNYDLHLVFRIEAIKCAEFSIRVAPFNTDEDPRDILHDEPTTLTFLNINEANLSRFLLFEIWLGDERHRAFLMKIDIDGLPETRVGRILRSIINSRDKFFEYLRFLLADDLEKGTLGSDDEPDTTGTQTENGDVWAIETPIFEQLLLAAARSPQRLKAIDDVIEQLQKDEESDTGNSVMPPEFLTFWNAFKQMIPAKQGEDNHD